MTALSFVWVHPYSQISGCDTYMQNNNGQYRNEIYNSAESMIPQLDGTYNISDSSDTDLHDYLD